MDIILRLPKESVAYPDRDVEFVEFHVDTKHAGRITGSHKVLSDVASRFGYKVVFEKI